MADEIAVVTATPPLVDPRTGEPPRPWQLWASVALLHLGAVLALAGLLWAMWTSIDHFAEAGIEPGSVEIYVPRAGRAGEHLHRVVPTELGDLSRVTLVTGTTAIALVVAAAAAIAAYYAWWGYGWTRWAGILAACLSPLTLMMNPLAMVAMAPVMTGAALLWLPPIRRFAAHWQVVRHPEAQPLALAGDVYYGPLPRYR